MEKFRHFFFLFLGAATKSGRLVIAKTADTEKNTHTVKLKTFKKKKRMTMCREINSPSSIFICHRWCRSEKVRKSSFSFVDAHINSSCCCSCLPWGNFPKFFFYLFIYFFFFKVPSSFYFKHFYRPSPTPPPQHLLKQAHHLYRQSTYTMCVCVCSTDLRWG
jgi:hypothetical protein